MVLRVGCRGILRIMVPNPYHHLRLSWSVQVRSCWENCLHSELFQNPLIWQGFWHIFAFGFDSFSWSIEASSDLSRRKWPSRWWTINRSGKILESYQMKLWRMVFRLWDQPWCLYLLRIILLNLFKLLEEYHWNHGNRQLFKRFCGQKLWLCGLMTFDCQLWGLELCMREQQGLQDR